MITLCDTCRVTVSDNTVWPVTCRCGIKRYSIRDTGKRVDASQSKDAKRDIVVHHQTKQNAEPVTRLRNFGPDYVSDNWAICNTNQCGQFNMGCSLLASKKIVKSCRTYEYIRSGGGCPANPPLFPPGIDQEHTPSGVGFIAVARLNSGGTETWHDTLLPRLNDVTGFVAFEKDLATGDMTRLGCPTGIGPEAASKLAARCKVLVVWGIGERLGDVIAPIEVEKRPMVISVSHCDDRSQWTIDSMLAQEPWSNHFVYICPSGINTVPSHRRGDATLIPNAADPDRVTSGRHRDEIRAGLGISPDDRMLLVTSRISREKRIDILAAALTVLPPRYKLVIAGSAQSWCADYKSEMQATAGDRIMMLPEVAHPGDLLCACDAVVSASEYEGYGLSMAEGILASRPLIATQCGLLESHPQLAAIVPMDATPQQWAVAIESDFSHAAEQLARVASARTDLLRDHGVETFVADWQSLISAIANRGT